MTQDMSYPVFTIGHSNMDLESLLGLLDRHRIHKVVDVRSQPFSRRLPHFNQNTLSDALQRAGMRYTHLGKELGGRPTADRLYDKEGRADYTRMAQEPSFIRAIKAIEKVSPNRRFALLCTEYEPTNCHRTLLVAHALHQQGVPITHILRDGKTEDHRDTVARLMARHRIYPEGDRESAASDAEQRAINAQSRAVAYRKRK